MNSNLRIVCLIYSYLSKCTFSKCVYKNDDITTAKQKPASEPLPLVLMMFTENRYRHVSSKKSHALTDETVSNFLPIQMSNSIHLKFAFWKNELSSKDCINAASRAKFFFCLTNIKKKKMKDQFLTTKTHAIILLSK